MRSPFCRKRFAPSAVDVAPSTMVIEKKKKKQTKIELSEEQKKVRDLVVKEGKNVFFTGSAGESRLPSPRQWVGSSSFLAWSGRCWLKE